VGVLLQGPNAEILLSNPKALELLGLTQDQLLGKTSFDPKWNVIHEDGSPFPGPTHPVPQAIATRQSVREVVMGVYRPVQGDRVWLLVYAEPQLNDEGTVKQVVCTFIDITERKQAEDALQENERLLRESQNAAHIGSYSLDLISGTWKASPEMYEIFGIDKSFPNTLDTWVQRIHEDFRDEISQNLFNSVSKGKLTDQEYKIVRFNDNIERWVHGVGEIEFDSQGNSVRMVGTIQDITSRKQAEEELKRLNEELEDRVNERTAELLKSNTALRNAEEKYRTVADFTYDWEYWINSEGQYNYISPSCERITGYTPEEFFSIEGLMDKIIYKADRDIWENLTLAQPDYDLEEMNQEIKFRIVTKTGSVRWIEHSCRRLYRDGKYMGIRASSRDITEKINTENELLNVTIEVEERERNRFSRELHDGLGPLLSTIKLYFQWLTETNNAEVVKIITEKGNKNIDIAIQTTREVALGLSSLVLNNSGYVDTIFDFTQSINELHKLTIDFTFNSKQRFGYLLEITLYRITTELINNTLKYAEATYVEINYNFIKGKKLILFSYSDDGIGFDLANVEKTSKGLGLKNIQHRLKIIGGNMRIETQIGKGVLVFIELPVKGTLNKAELKNKQKSVNQ